MGNSSRGRTPRPSPSGSPGYPPGQRSWTASWATTPCFASSHLTSWRRLHLPLSATRDTPWTRPPSQGTPPSLFWTGRRSHPSTLASSGGCAACSGRSWRRAWRTGADWMECTGARACSQSSCCCPRGPRRAVSCSSRSSRVPTGSWSPCLPLTDRAFTSTRLSPRSSRSSKRG